MPKRGWKRYWECCLKACRKDKMGGSLEFEEITDSIGLRPEYLSIRNFVETGTYKGDTSIMASKHFHNVYTTEIVPALHEESKKKAEEAGVKNITFLLGDSVKLLGEIMPKVSEGAVFFLDAHQSGGDTSNNGKNVPLYEELDVILSFPLGKSLFIIDDVRLWKQKCWDWAHITNTELVKRFSDKGRKVHSYFEKNDRFFIVS
jgi:hypothetical protein